MIRRMVCLALLAFPLPAIACMNDDELPAHEREFRSQYVDATPVEPGPSLVPVSSRVLIAGGLALLAGAAVVTFSRGRTRSVP
jgi:hypothetical protein